MKIIRDFYQTEGNKFGVFVSLFFSLLFLGSFDVSEYLKHEYRIEISPSGASTGPVKLVFYGDSAPNIIQNNLKIPATGWSIVEFADGASVTSETNAPPILITTKSEALQINLLKSAQAGIAKIKKTNGEIIEINLSSKIENIHSLHLGGKGSITTPEPSNIGAKHLELFILFSTLITLFGIYKLIYNHSKKAYRLENITASEQIWNFLIPATTSSLVFLCYFPGHAAYDSAVQWLEALNGKTLNSAIGIPATLTMRVFAQVSPSPWLLILTQYLLSALAISLILSELRLRGVTKFITTIYVIALSISPQYAFFVTYLSKDALSLIGILFFTWGILRFTRDFSNGNQSLLQIIFWICTGLFAGFMRSNIFPAVALVIIAVSLYLFKKKRYLLSSTVLGLYFGGLLLVSIAISDFSSHNPSDRMQVATTTTNSTDRKAPLGFWGNIYIYHLFSAFIAEGVDIAASDKELFTKIAPLSFWKEYDCKLTDTTFASISRGITMSQLSYGEYLAQNQLKMGQTVLKLIATYPKVLIKRQLCITEIIWYIGFHQKDFQVTLTRGFDTVTPEFRSLAGNNTSLLPNSMRNLIGKVSASTESSKYYWLFWRPALPLFVSYFLALIALYLQTDTAIVLMLLLSTACILVLLVTIPFPAYRYLYPIILVASLISLFAFRRNSKERGKLAVGV